MKCSKCGKRTWYFGTRTNDGKADVAIYMCDHCGTATEKVTRD